MLSPSSYTPLTRCGPVVIAVLESQKRIFKLIHSRVSEQECGVVVRHQRARRDARMPLALKIRQKRFSNFSSLHAWISKLVTGGVLLGQARSKLTLFHVSTSEDM